MSLGTSQQFYVTHCARNDSVLNTVGFSVRAASSTEPALLKMAMEYPAFELPMDQWAKRPSRFDAPRRLARVRVPEGVMVVHTGYLEKDTMNRDRSFFTHLTVLPVASPSDVLKSWNAPGWRTDYPSGENKTLGIPTQVPTGTSLSEKTLREFLSAADLGPGGVLSTALWSDKLRTDLAGRKALVGQVLHGILLAMADPNRNRLFIHAEPGLVALLIFAAAELLPPSVSDDLTFTTFEPAHRGLREYKRALIVGTYLANPTRGLDAELTSARGYAVDAINPARGSRELLAEVPPGIVRLIELAAAGKKKSIKSVHEICGNGRMYAAEIGRAVMLAEGLERLDAKTHTVEDLLELQKHPQGQKALAAREAELWPQVCALAVDKDRDDVLNAFRPWFARPNRVDQLAVAGFAALSGGNTAGWNSRWRVIQNVLPAPAELGAVLDRLLGARADAVISLPPAGRSAIRASLGNVKGIRREVLGPILTPGTITELDQLLGDKTLSAFGLGFVAFTARTGNVPAMQKRASAYLQTAPPQVLGHYANQLGPDYDQYCEAADEIFDLNPDGTAPLFDRLLGRGREYLEPAGWMWAAERLELFKSDVWTEHMLQNLRLAYFLRSVGADPIGRPAWDWTFDRIKGTAILDPNGVARRIWVQLNAADVTIRNEGGNPVEVFPPRITTLRAAGRRLFALTEPAGPMPSSSEIRAAFDEFGLDESSGLHAIFKLICADNTPASDPTVYQRFGAIFGSVLPSSNTMFQPNNRSLSAWLELSGTCPDESRAEMHAYYFQHPDLATSDAKQRILLVDEHRATLDSRVATDVRMDSKRTRVDEKQEARAEKERAAKKSKWLLWLLLIGLAGGAIAVGSQFIGKSESEPEPEVAQNNMGKSAPVPAPKDPITLPTVTVKPPIIVDVPMPIPMPPMLPIAPAPTPILKSKVDGPPPPESVTGKKPPDMKPKEDKASLIAAKRKEIANLVDKLSKTVNASQLPLEKPGEIIAELNDGLTPKYGQLLEITQGTPEFKQYETEMNDWTTVKSVLSKLSTKREKLATVDAGKTWLLDLGSEFDKLVLSDAAKGILQTKAQQLCELYMPQKLALETFVIANQDKLKRSDFEVVTDSGKEKWDNLDPDGPHEQSDRIKKLLLKDKEYSQKKISPTAKSALAIAYRTERKKLEQWNDVSTNSLADVFAKEMNAETWNSIPVFLEKSLGRSEIRTRFSNLREVIKKHPKLFEPAKKDMVDPPKKK